jgi:hypothetical protein
MESEDRRPEGTLYHLNQFQTNTGITMKKNTPNICLIVSWLSLVFTFWGFVNIWDNNNILGILFFSCFIGFPTGIIASVFTEKWYFRFLGLVSMAICLFFITLIFHK